MPASRPVCRPLVDVTEGVAAAEHRGPVVPVVEEPELLLDDDIPPPPPPELDWSTCCRHRRHRRPAEASVRDPLTAAVSSQLRAD